MKENGPAKRKMTKAEDTFIYKKLQSFLGKRCKLVLKDGEQPVGNLNHVGVGPRGPYIIFDVGDDRVSAQYNLNFDNISGVVDER